MTFNQLPQADPKLKEAAREIDAICEKYGIAGFYGLASSTHAEFKVNFPSWCGIQLDERRGYRVKLRRDEREKAEASVHVAFSSRDMAGLMFQNYEAICTELQRHFEVNHQPFPGLWDMDGWQNPALPPLPFEVVDFRNPKPRSRGFGKKTDPQPGPVVEAVATLIGLADQAGGTFTIDLPNLDNTADRGLILAFRGDPEAAESLSQYIKANL